MAHSVDFREDINGLRAVAVLAVLLFHLDYAAVGGGFLGVDMFFVISGYLITRLILRDLKRGDFSFAGFYYRRARRLLPALLVTVAVSLIVGFWLFPPRHFSGLAESALYTTVWISNFFFFFDSHYFSAEAITKPLLHTWSLGVEEQFYLVWPLLLWAAFRFRRSRGVLIAIAGSFAASLLASQWAVRAAPDAAFFMTPFRMFEFAIGGLVVPLERRRIRLHPLFANSVVALGLASLIASFVLFSDKTNFPGVSALVVSVATAAVIAAGPVALSRPVLANPVYAYLGRISYSLYLVHWPIVVFYRYYVFRELEGWERAGLLAATIICGVLLYHLVEQRFRTYDFLGRDAPQRAVRSGWLAGAGLVTAFAATVLIGHGFVWRSPSYFAPGYIDQQFGERYRPFKTMCREQDEWTSCPAAHRAERLKVLVLGDSHAGDGLTIVQNPLGDEWLTVNAYPGCPPVAPSTSYITAPCKELNRKRFDPDYLKQFDVIVVSVIFLNFGPRELELFLSAVKTSVPDKKVIVLGNFVLLKHACWEIIERFGRQQCARRDMALHQFLYEEDLARTVQKFGYLFVSKRDALCDQAGTCLMQTAAGIPFAWDQHHLSYEFAGLIGEKVRGQIRDYVYGPQQTAAVP